MKYLRQTGFWLPVLIMLGWGAVIMAGGDDAAREKAFTLVMFVGLASSLNILLGYTGYVSFGHIVFFGMGGYMGFFLMAVPGWSLPVAALVGGVFSAIIAALLGLAVLRLRGAYFALATIGVNEAARAFVSNFEPFGGSTGLSLNFSAYEQYGGAGKALWLTFALMVAVTAAALLASAFIRNSRFGLGLFAIREDEDAAMVMGVRTSRAKTIAYMVSAFFPGVIGTLYFFKNGNVEPGDAFQLHMSIELLVMVMLGGQGTVLGPMLGAVTYQGMRGYMLTSPLFKDLHLAVAGALLLMIVLFVPAGLTGWLRTRFPRLRGILE